MSDTKKLSDVLKASPAATSLESTDRLMSVSSDGSLKSISRDNFLSQGNRMFFTVSKGDQKWIRIAKMTDYGSFCILIMGYVGYNGGWGIPVGLTISAPHGNSLPDMIVEPLNGIHKASVGQLPFSKIRITGEEGKKYIDVLVCTSATIDRRMAIVLGPSLATELMTPTDNCTLMSKTKEFEITDIFSGGVKRGQSIVYVITRKGGVRRNGGNETAHRSNHEGIVDGRDGRAWLLLRHRRNEDSGHISRERGRCHRDIAGIRSAGRLDIRHSGGGEREGAALRSTPDLRHGRRGREDMAQRMASLETVDTVAIGKEVAYV